TGLESEKECFETCANHETRNLRRDETSVERVGCVKRNAGILTQHRLDEWKENAIGLKEQRIIIECDVPCTEAGEEPHFFDTDIQRPGDKIRVHDRNRAVGAAKGTSFGNLDNSDPRVNALPKRKTIRQRKAQRPEIQPFQHLIHIKRPGMVRTEAAV